MDRSGRVACFELLRDAGANLEAKDARDYRPLHFSALRADVEMVSLLIQAGVNVNVTSRDGFTPLHETTSRLSYVKSNVDCADLLLKAGAAVNVKANGWTPLAIAINRRHRRMLPVFLRAGAEIPEYVFTVNGTWQSPYILRVQSAGGFKKYAQQHLAAMTKLFAANGRRLPPEVVRQIMKFWLHLGYY